MTGVETVHSDLTYDLRSGDPDALDQMAATTFANIAVELLADGISGRMVAIHGGKYTHALPDPGTRLAAAGRGEHVQRGAPAAALRQPAGHATPAGPAAARLTDLALSRRAGRLQSSAPAAARPAWPPPWHPGRRSAGRSAPAPAGRAFLSRSGSSADSARVALGRQAPPRRAMPGRGAGRGRGRPPPAATISAPSGADSAEPGVVQLVHAEDRGEEAVEDEGEAARLAMTVCRPRSAGRRAAR